MKKFLALFAALAAVPSFAGNSPIIWGPTCAFDLISQSCVATSSSNSITALTGDVTATGPGSVPATLKNVAHEYWVDVGQGNDSNTGTIVSKWLTIQHACNTAVASINFPAVIHLSGGNNDAVAGHDPNPIVCPPNINIVADYGIQIQPLTISGGSGNDGVFLSNLLPLGNITWIRNDATAMGLTLQNVAPFGTVDFEQQGAGYSSSTFLAVGANSTLFGGLTVRAGLVVLQSAGLIEGTVNYKDSGGGLMFVTGADLFSTTFQLNGGETLELAGNIADSGYAVSGTATGSGTPTIISDSGSLPSTVNGAYSFTATSMSQWTDFTKGALIGGVGAPSTTNVLLEIHNGHLKVSQTTVPTATVQGAAGTGASCSVLGAPVPTDHDGVMQVTFGSGSFSTGDQCRVNFNKPYDAAPNCVLYPANAQAANDGGGNHQVYRTTNANYVAVAYGLAQNSTGAVGQWAYHCQ